MVKELSKEVVKGCIKTYIVDAWMTYSACYITGFSAIIGYIAVKDGIKFGKIVVSGAKKLIAKLPKKGEKQTESASADENKPEQPAQE